MGYAKAYHGTLRKAGNAALDLRVRCRTPNFNFTASISSLTPLTSNRIALLVVGFGTPILFTLLTYLPYTTSIFERLKPYLVYPTIIGTYQVRPLPYLLGNAPTLGQTLYIALLVILNIAFTAAGYTTSEPNAWFASSYQETMGYLSSRTGVLAFAMAPLVILLSGRNNILLWLTNWSHSTYMLLHRWVARLFGVQVILHSILELALYINNGEYAGELPKGYWVWGAVATVATSVMLVASMLVFRRMSYEAFLILHIVLAVFVLAGSWYHVELLFQRKWGYEAWIYAACAVWFADRVVRVLRVAKVGLRRAKVTNVGGGIVRVDIEGVRWAPRPGVHAYAYFPTLHAYKPWENHPFSVIPTAMLRSRGHTLAAVGTSDGQSPTAGSASSLAERDVEKRPDVVATHTTTANATTTTAGVSLYIKKCAGSTKLLSHHDGLLTLLDGPYPSNPTAGVLQCDRLLLIGGGIGVTGILPWIDCHPNVKLCWSVKESSESIVQDLEPVLKGVAEKEIKVGRRLDVRALLAQEVQAGWKKIGVVVCGPGGLCDDVRAAVVVEGKKGGALFELEVDAFSW